MKRSLVVIILACVLCLAIAALAADVKPVVLKLDKTQQKAIKGATTDPVDITLTASQIAKVKKTWAAFAGTTAKVTKAHIYNKKMVDVMFDGTVLASVVHGAAPTPPPPPPAPPAGQ